MPTPSRVPLGAVLLLLLLCILWGGNVVSIRFIGHGISPFLAATIRSVVALALLAALTQVTGRKILPAAKDFWPMAGIGLLFALNMVFLYRGLVYTHASRGILFLYMDPIWVALGAHFFLPNDRLNTAKCVGLLAAFGGILLVFGSRSVSLGPLYWVGDLMMMAAGLFWAATTLLIKRVAQTRGVTHYQTLAAQHFFSIPVLAAAWLVFEFDHTFQLDGAIGGALAYQCVVVAFISYLLWFWMIEHHPVSRLASFVFLAPLFGVLLGGFLLGEQIPPLLWGGLALVAVGIYLVNLAPRPQASEEAKIGVATGGKEGADLRPELKKSIEVMSD